MSAKVFDSHAHMDSDYFDDDREEVFEQLRQEIAGMINPGCDNETSLKAITYAETYDFVYAAVGEIGLDYYYDDSAPRELQRKRFIEQLDLARRVDLPVIIHDRDAHGDMLDIFHNEGKGLRGVFHCYSGSLETAKELLKMGFYLGFGGSSTFKNAEKVRNVLKYVPEDKILFETDSPYLTPVPYRGKRNNPAYTLLVAQNAALVRGTDVESLIEKSTENVKKLFSKIV